MNNKKMVIIAISAVLGVILIVSLAVGLAFGLKKIDNRTAHKKKESTKIHKEVEEKVTSKPRTTPEPTSEPTPEPTHDPTPEPTPEPVDYKTELLDKLVGIWGEPGGGFIQYFDSGDIYSGWFESESRPPQHILEVTKIDENKYELLIKEDEWEYEGEKFESITSKFIYDGSYDEFEKVLHISNDYGEEYLLWMGDTFEEAESHLGASFDEEYEKFEKEVLNKVRE